MKTDKCRSCGAPIIWSITTNGRRMPLDAAPVENGNIMLGERAHLPPLALYVATALKEQIEFLQPGDKLYTSHFATCPQSKTWRKK